MSCRTKGFNVNMHTMRLSSSTAPSHIQTENMNGFEAGSGHESDLSKSGKYEWFPKLGHGVIHWPITCIDDTSTSEHPGVVLPHGEVKKLALHLP